MSQLRRLAKIYYIAGKYRIDTLVDKSRLPLTARIALAPLKLFGNQADPAANPCVVHLRTWVLFLLNLVNCCQPDQTL